MALVVVPVVFPAVLAGQSNGQLPEAILIPTAGLQGGPTVRLVTTAARCWRALAATAPADGIVLQATSPADSYRDLDQQIDVFTRRYQVEPTANGYRLWDSDGNGTRERWYKKDGVATAAVPGTSNHGWGLAVDVANASGARLRWLEQNAPRFGWSWETVPEEPWHVRNVTGDAIPKAVRDHEQEQSMTTLDDVHKGPDGVNRSYAKMIADVHDGYFWTTYSGAYPGSVQARLQTLLDRPPAQVAMTPEDRDAIAAAVAAQLAPLIEQAAAAAGAEARDAVADLGEGGATKVRADA